MSYVAILKVNASTNRVEKFQSFSTEEEAEAHVQKFIGTYPLAYCVGEPNSSSTHWLCDTSTKTIAISKLKDEPIIKEYQKNREKEYPKIGDQLDMLWHSIDQDAALKQKYFAFHQAILAVKSKYPK